MTEQETRRIAREEIARALEAMQGDCFDRSSANRLHPPAEAVEVVGKTIDAALAALREPEPSAEPVMLWRAWNRLGNCIESDIQPEFERLGWFASLEGATWRHATAHAGQHVLHVEWIGPGPDPREASESAGAMLARLGTDGREWAVEFRKTALRLGYSDMDEGWLIGWFCNAIQAGADAEALKQKARADEAEKRGREKMREEVAKALCMDNWHHAADIVRRLP